MPDNIKFQKAICKNCGTEQIFNSTSQIKVCNFCGNSFIKENIKRDVEIIMPDFILPFKISKKDFKDRFLEWLSEGEYIPDDILTSSIFDEHIGIYLPMYFYTGEYNSSWSASSGYNRTEYYREWDSSRKEYEKKTRTVTDWKASNGQVSGSYSIFGFAEKDRKKMGSFGESAGFGKGDLKNYDKKDTLNFPMLEFNKSEDETWNTSGNRQLNFIIFDKIKHSIPGDRSKDITHDANYKHDSLFKILVPVWIVYYKYNKNKYHFIMDGFDFSRISGKKPENVELKQDVKRKNLPGNIGCIISIIMFFVGGAIWADDGTPIVFVLSIIFGIIAKMLITTGKNEADNLIKESKDKRQQVLKEMKSEDSVETEKPIK